MVFSNFTFGPRQEAIDKVLILLSLEEIFQAINNLITACISIFVMLETTAIEFFLSEK